MADQITFACDKCGSERFQIPDNPQPHDTVTCAGCGASARYDEIQKLALKRGKKAVVDALAGAFKGIKGFSPK